MHDPKTVAFDINSPIKDKPSKFWPNGYRKTLITIWHEDPCKGSFEKGTRDDDTCGWLTPPTTKADRELIRKLGREIYHNIFERQHVETNGIDMSFIDHCFVPTAYDAVYWTWRAIKSKLRGKRGWMFGDGSNYLTHGELQEIYKLSANPIDNFRHTIANIKNEEDCASFFLSIYRCYLRHHRPWYKHPRWHVWHWRIQVHPTQNFKRWAFSRCAECGGRFTWGYSPVSSQWYGSGPKWFKGESGVYHHDCSGTKVKPE